MNLGETSLLSYRPDSSSIGAAFLIALHTRFQGVAFTAFTSTSIDLLRSSGINNIPTVERHPNLTGLTHLP